MSKLDRPPMLEVCFGLPQYVQSTARPGGQANPSGKNRRSGWIGISSARTSLFRRVSQLIEPATADSEGIGQATRKRALRSLPGMRRRERRSRLA